jgi:potassium-transporting ATPase KdpC subunit
MARMIGGSVVAVVAMTLFFGLLYPVVMTGFASVAFPGQSRGSLVDRNGVLVGSTLAAQGFTWPKYFHERPSATAPAYNAAGTTFSNLGPTNPALASLVSDNAKAILKLEGPYNPGLTINKIPVDAVVPSASGIDPEISQAYAQLQAARVASVRHLPLSTVQSLISKNTIGRWIGIFGEPGVNVLDLNLALDKETGK